MPQLTIEVTVYMFVQIHTENFLWKGMTAVWIISNSQISGTCRKLKQRQAGHLHSDPGVTACRIKQFFTHPSVQGRFESVLLVHLTFLLDSVPCSTQRDVRTSHICKIANTIWRRWQWDRWADVMCCCRNKSFRTHFHFHRQKRGWCATSGHTKHTLTRSKRSA